MESFLSSDAFLSAVREFPQTLSLVVVVIVFGNVMTKMVDGLVRMAQIIAETVRSVSSTLDSATMNAPEFSDWSIGGGD